MRPKRAPKDDPIGLGVSGLVCHRGDHIGHFYESAEEWLALAVGFLRAGLERGELCVYLAPRERRERLVEALERAGIDVPFACRGDRLVIEEGRTDVESLRRWLAQALARVPGQFPLLRWGGEMSWALETLRSTERLMEWETHCNVVEEPPAVFLCQYDLGLSTGKIVMDALRTHPLCIVGSTVHRNPFFVRPEDFLSDRGSSPDAS